MGRPSSLHAVDAVAGASRTNGHCEATTGGKTEGERRALRGFPTSWGDPNSWMGDFTGVGIDVPTIGDVFHITKTNICWKLYPLSSWVM